MENKKTKYLIATFSYKTSSMAKNAVYLDKFNYSFRKEKYISKKQVKKYHHE
tara:strand:+ start:129 stop:284 length:156 start_codon:yes stop_codon:yes gene_type:complete